MVTKNKLVYDLVNIYRGGVQSDDEILSLRQVSFWVDNTRAELIRQDFEKKRSISDNVVQTIGCLPVELIDASECPCNIASGCTIMRTVQQLPTTIETYHKNLITKIGPSLVGQRAYTIISYQRAPVFGSNKYNKNEVAAFLHNRYVYLINADPELSFISLDGVFEYPEEVAAFFSCDGEACYTDDSRYPISAHMIEVLKQKIMTVNFSVLSRALPDSTGNADSKVQPNIER
jgi:hypothetical protein